MINTQFSRQSAINSGLKQIADLEKHIDRKLESKMTNTLQTQTPWKNS